MKTIQWSKYISPESKFYEKYKNKKGLFITGQNGIVFPDDLPDKKFNMYEGLANFMISVKDFEDIKNTPGIELIYPVTGYRIRLGIAPTFNDKEVLTKIDRKLDPYTGVHDEIVSKYLGLAKLKYPDYILFEDYNKMICVTDEKNEPNLLGFTIFRANPRPSGV